MSLIIAVPMLGIVIMIHESGHFLFAKLNGISVTEFSLGMEPRLFSFEKGDARYFFKVLPFGGSCTILRKDEGTIDKSAFSNKPVRARISMVVAGSVFNLTLALGLSVMLISTTRHDTARLAGIVDGYPAQAIGMEAGDVIKSINDRKVHSYRDINWHLFTHPQKPLTVIWERTEEGGRTRCFSTEFTLVFPMENNQYMMGVQLSPAPNMAENIGQLLIYSAYEVQYWIHHMLNTFYVMFRGVAFVNDISGPVRIVNAIDVAMDEAASYGMSAVVSMSISLTVLSSANLGIVNLLPVPTLDDGCLVSLIIGAVRGKPIDKEKEGMVHMVRTMAFLTFTVLILFNDMRKLF